MIPFLCAFLGILMMIIVALVGGVKGAEVTGDMTRTTIEVPTKMTTAPLGETVTVHAGEWVCEV